MQKPLLQDEKQEEKKDEKLKRIATDKAFLSGLGIDAYANFLAAYGGTLRGPTRCVVDGKAEWIEADPTSEDIAVPVLFFLYVPYFCKQLATALLAQIQYIFIVQQLGGGLSYVAWVGMLNRIARVVGGPLGCNKMKSLVPNRLAWPADYFISFMSYLSFALAPNALVYALASAFFAQLGGFGAWQNMEITYVVKQDQPHGANLRVLCRYASGFFGPFCGLLIANHCPGQCRATYLAAALVCLALTMYARHVCHLTGFNPDTLQKKNKKGSSDDDKATEGQMYILKNHLPEFVVAAVFTSCTGLTRSGYAQTLNLRALQDPGVTHHDTTITISVSSVFAFAFGLIVPKLIRDGDMIFFRQFGSGGYSIKRAAVPSFLVLTFGYLTLAFSSSLGPLLLSGVLFGIGEGLSAGLQLVVQNNVIQEVQRKEEEIGLRNKTQIGKLFKAMLTTWSQIGLWANAASPLLGAKYPTYGMTIVSLLYCSVGCFATVYCMFLPSWLNLDTKKKDAQGAGDDVSTTKAKVIRCPMLCF